MSYQRASGHATEYDITCLGYNFRMDDIRAAIAIEQLKKLSSDLRSRITVRKRYVTRLTKNPRIAVPFADCEEFTSNYIFPIVILDSTKEKRDALREYIHADFRSLSCSTQVFYLQRARCCASTNRILHQ